MVVVIVLEVEAVVAVVVARSAVVDGGCGDDGPWWRPTWLAVAADGGGDRGDGWLLPFNQIPIYHIWIISNEVRLVFLLVLSHHCSTCFGGTEVKNYGC